MINYSYWLPLINIKVHPAHFIHMHTAIKASTIALWQAIWVIVFIFQLVFYSTLSWTSENGNFADSKGHVAFGGHSSGNDINPESRNERDGKYNF